MHQMGTTAGVIGASGYAGGELLRLLARHPAIEVVGVAGASRAGERLDVVQPHLAGLVDLHLGAIEEAVSRVDVCFSCLPHGVLPGYLDAIGCDLLVDLAEDFRADGSWVYGLPELDRSLHRGAARIANPGCYPTASLLCLVPFARAGWIGDSVIIDALSGVSGAGRAPRDGLLFTTIAGGAAAYGSVEHRHVAEIERGLSTFGGSNAAVSFTPHLVPMSRGLLVTARFAFGNSVSDAEARDVLRDLYDGEPLVQVVEDWPATKPLVGTNRAQVSARVDRRSGYVIASCAIDNLGKGAAGQALQNANLALGLEETTGLEAVAAWP